MRVEERVARQQLERLSGAIGLARRGAEAEQARRVGTGEAHPAAVIVAGSAQHGPPRAAQGKAHASVQEDFAESTARADVWITSSRF